MTTCLDLRDRLAEDVLAALPADERAEVEEHLRWCAGCRREANELAEASAVLAHAAGAADPPPWLGDRVAAAVAEASGSRRRSRAGVLAAVLAAFLAVATAGWGAVMAGRAQRLQGAAEDARRDAERTAMDFAEVIRDVAGRGPVEEMVLRSPGQGAARGRAILFDVGEGAVSDWVLVVVGGLPERGGPYRARATTAGATLALGELSAVGQDRLAAYRLLPSSTHGYATVAVVDASGRLRLSGHATR